MKISTKFAVLAFGAASLIALMAAPASAQTVGGSKCSQFRDQNKKSQCLTRATDPMNDMEGNLKRQNNFVAAHGPTTTTIVPDPNRTGVKHLVVDGPGYRFVDGIGSGKASGMGTTRGRGGSGGKRSANRSPSFDEVTKARLTPGSFFEGTAISSQRRGLRRGPGFGR